MGFLENIFPLIFIYFVWKVFSKIPKSPADSEPEGKTGRPKSSIPDNDQMGSIDPVDLLRQIFFGGERPLAESASGRVPDSAPSRSTERIEEVMEEYDLTKENILNALSYAAKLMREEEVRAVE